MNEMNQWSLFTFSRECRVKKTCPFPTSQYSLSLPHQKDAACVKPLATPPVLSSFFPPLKSIRTAHFHHHFHDLLPGQHFPHKPLLIPLPGREIIVLLMRCVCVCVCALGSCLIVFKLREGYAFPKQ